MTRADFLLARRLLGGLHDDIHAAVTAARARQAAGLRRVVEGPSGRPLKCPLDTTSPVAWIGYANRVLARKVRPVLRKVLSQTD
ncbi:MAG: hypothetical protein HS122_18890 [Opitutaceae bacterium]|nr:hypothetical protein [Opitutaceae bacterium]